MKKRLLLLLLAQLFASALSNRISASEVQETEVVSRSDGVWHRYAIIVGSKPDERFQFSAQMQSEGHWELYFRPSDTFDWAAELPSKEYTEAIYECVDRFVTDFPNAPVWSVHMCVTQDSRNWQDIRKRLTAFLSKQTDPAVRFPGVTHAMAVFALRSSPEYNEISRHLSARLKRKVHITTIDMPRLVMRHTARDDFARTWPDIVKLPDLSIDFSSLSFSIEFEDPTRFR